jgi:serine/threonine protein kinase
MDAVFEDYLLEAEIGGGSVGVVFRARQLATDRLVAVKILRKEAAADPRLVARFRREAETLSLLRHPHVIRILDHGQVGDQLYLVMELVDGLGLDARLREDGRLEPAEAARVVRCIAEALEAAGEQDIVHRDIKPSNVLLDDEGVVKVLDFSIAKLLGDDEGLTRTRDFLGTLRYASPEQIAGRPVDARSDQYSLGAVFFELLTGRPPFPGNDAAEVVRQHAEEMPPSPSQVLPGLPEKLDAIVLRMLAKDPDDRYPAARHLVRAIEAFEEDTLESLAPLPDAGAVLPDPLPLPEPVRLRAGNGNETALVALIVALLGLLGAAATGALVLLPVSGG